jgi:Ca2+/H+ antiporter
MLIGLPMYIIRWPMYFIIRFSKWFWKQDKEGMLAFVLVVIVSATIIFLVFKTCTKAYSYEKESHGQNTMAQEIP